MKTREFSYSSSGRKPAGSRIAALLAALAAIAMPTTAEGRTVKQIRKVTAFTSIVLDGVGTVRVRKGPLAVTVTIDEDLADSFETDVEGGVLKLGYRPGLGTGFFARRLSECEVEVSVPTLDGVTVNGAGRLSFEGFKGGSIRVETNGSAIVAGSVDHDALRVRMTGSGKVELKGRAVAVDVGCSGSAALAAGSLSAKSAKVGVTGSGRVELMVAETLWASVSGSGSVRYRGSPTLEKSVSGSGSVTKVGD